MRRLNQWYECQLLEQQYGFRSGRGTTDGIYILKRIQQISHNRNKQVFVLFVDLTAAFDHVDRKWMFSSIHQRLSPNTSTKLFELMESIYKYTTTALKDNPDDIFETALGVRQGGPESPSLFNLYIDYVMRVFLKLCTQKRIEFIKANYAIPSLASSKNTTSSLAYFGEINIDWIGYADDLALCFNSLNDLQNGLNLLNETFKRFNLTINETKTKTMILNYNQVEEYPSTITTLDNMPIDNVKFFIYLGCLICYDEPATGESEINLRIDSAENKFYQHGNKFMNHKIHLTTRVNLLNSLVRSRLAYACQTWTLTKSQIDQLSSVYTSMIRKMVRKGYRRKGDTWSFVLTNEQLLQIGKTEDLKSFIAKQQKRYLAHTIRRDDSSLAKKLLFSYSRSTRGRQLMTLMDAVTTKERCSVKQVIDKSVSRIY